MTGQFLQWKYAPCPAVAAAASRCAITSAFCPSHLISFCHLSGLLFSLSLSHHFSHPSSPHPPIPANPPLAARRHAPSFFYWCSTFRPSCSRRRRFHPSWCRSLNPPSFALLGPHPSRFSPTTRFFRRAVPFPPAPRRFPCSS